MLMGADKFTDKNTKSEYTYVQGVQLQKRTRASLLSIIMRYSHITVQYRINFLYFHETSNS